MPPILEFRNKPEHEEELVRLTDPQILKGTEGHRQGETALKQKVLRRKKHLNFADMSVNLGLPLRPKFSERQKNSFLTFADRGWQKRVFLKHFLNDEYL